MKLSRLECDVSYARGELRKLNNEANERDERIKELEVGLKILLSKPHQFISPENRIKLLAGKLDECQTCFWYFGKCNHNHVVIEISENPLCSFELIVECLCEERMDYGNCSK